MLCSFAWVTAQDSSKQGTTCTGMNNPANFFYKRKERIYEQQWGQLMQINGAH